MREQKAERPRALPYRRPVNRLSYPNYHFCLQGTISWTPSVLQEQMMRPLNRYDYYVSSNVELMISPNSIIYPPLWRNGTNMNQTHIGDLGTTFGLSSSIAGTSYTNVNPAMKHALSRWALRMWTINSLMHSEFTERILSCHIIFRM